MVGGSVREEEEGEDDKEDEEGGSGREELPSVVVVGMFAVEATAGKEGAAMRKEA